MRLSALWQLQVLEAQRNVAVKLRELNESNKNHWTFCTYLSRTRCRISGSSTGIGKMSDLFSCHVSKKRKRQSHIRELLKRLVKACTAARTVLLGSRTLDSSKAVAF
eukprot:IDg18932t1